MHTHTAAAAVTALCFLFCFGVAGQEEGNGEAEPRASPGAGGAEPTETPPGRPWPPAHQAQGEHQHATAAGAPCEYTHALIGLIGWSSVLLSSYDRHPCFFPFFLSVSGAFLSCPWPIEECCCFCCGGGCHAHVLHVCTVPSRVSVHD